MPELPELEIVREVLTRRLGGRRIDAVTLAPKGAAVIVRDLTGEGFVAGIAGTTLGQVRRRGKFLIFDFPRSPFTLVANPKLSGRFQLTTPGGKKAGPVHATFHFSDPDEQLRYVDSKQMGQLYLTRDTRRIPTFDEMGPDALEASREDFGARLKPFRGEIKGVLTRAQFLAGIGNAYADEILWRAKIHPFRKRTRLSPEEIDALYDAMRQTLLEAIEQVRKDMGDDVHLKPRDFFAVHLRGGQPCPRCGTTISEITANQRITSFCRKCQPGGLIRGMNAPRPSG
ncbi:MAG TPA: DNA-formamidopyrimidine glycosylase family protein [Anaerolineales bacterium]|nr:DNA-formamidopyrimidine glycosylase family protein [Anaerolineales bacterium]